MNKTRGNLLKILGIALITLLIIVIGLILRINNEREIIETTTVSSFSIKPTQKANSTKRDYTTIICSNREILNNIAKKVTESLLPEDELIEEKDKINRIHVSGQDYYIAIPSSYFSSLKCQLVSEFDFSGIDCSNLKTLPDFSLWPSLKTINFSNCNITDISGFSGNARTRKLKNVRSIDLSSNQIQNPPSDIVMDTRFKLNSQHIRILVGTIQKGTSLKRELPAIFTQSYGSLQAPKNLLLNRS